MALWFLQCIRSFNGGTASSAICTFGSTKIGAAGDVDEEAAAVDLSAAILEDDGALDCLFCLSCTLSAAVAILPYPISTLSRPSGVSDSADSILALQTELCPFLVRPSSSMAMHAEHPGVYPCLSKSAGTNLTLLPAIPGSSKWGSGASSMPSGGAKTGARKNSGEIPGVGLSGVPEILSSSSMLHLSSSGLRLIDLPFTTPLGVPISTSVDRTSMPNQIPSSYRGSGA